MAGATARFDVSGLSVERTRLAMNTRGMARFLGIDRAGTVQPSICKDTQSRLRVQRVVRKVNAMPGTSINIDAHLSAKAKRLEEVIESLRDLQIVESCEHARVGRIERLRRCVESLDDAVEQIEAVHGDRLS